MLYVLVNDGRRRANIPAGDICLWLCHVIDKD
jgi:hypothetical protein